jgi:hypothetical protein
VTARTTPARVPDGCAVSGVLSRTVSSWASTRGQARTRARHRPVGFPGARPGDDAVVPDIDVGPYLEAVVEAAREVLGTGFAGAYAAGSVALNASRPGRGDIDVVQLCRGQLGEAVKRGLIARLRHRALPCPARGLELVVYTLAAARSGTAKPGSELKLNDGPARAFRQGLQPARRPAADGTFWYGLDRSILRQGGRALVRHRHGRRLSKVDAGRRLLVAGYRPVEVIEQSIAARSGEPPPSGRQERTFQEAFCRSS